MKRELIRYYTEAEAAGLSYEQANGLRRDAQRLHTISEHECNGVLYRAEQDGYEGARLLEKDCVYWVSNINGPGPLRYTKTADRETPARKRIEDIAASINATVDFQGDPRGWPVQLKLKSGATLSPPVWSR